MISAVVFIGLAIVALVELCKRLEAKDYRGVIVIVGAALIGALIGVLDTHIGVTDVSVAQGIVIGLDAVGVHQIARQVG